jgi:hypothetical protein
MMAGLAGAYLAYVDCVRKGTGEKMSIVAVFSQGDDDNLMVGRNGIFYDRKGRDYDATISKIVSNPISIRQAFFSPYKKLVRMIEEQVAKRAAVADAAVNTQLAQTAEQTANAEKATAAAAQPAKKFDTGTVAALGVALGLLATAFGIIFATLADFAPWKMAFVMLGVILVISLPSVIIAALKLRKRNLGPILDGNGWAVNAKAKAEHPLRSVADQRRHVTRRRAPRPGRSVRREPRRAQQSHCTGGVTSGAVKFVVLRVRRTITTPHSAEIGLRRTQGSRCEGCHSGTDHSRARTRDTGESAEVALTEI